MNIAFDSQWNREASNFAMDNNDYEKAFESYISDVDDDDGELKCFWGDHASITDFVTYATWIHLIPFLVLPNGQSSFIFVVLSTSIRRLTSILNRRRWFVLMKRRVAILMANRSISSPLTYLFIKLSFPSAPHDTITRKVFEFRLERRRNLNKGIFSFGHLYSNPKN